MKIKKVSQTVPTSAQVVNGYGTSQTDTYSQEYSNNTFATKDVATTALNGLMSSVDKGTLDSIFGVPVDTVTDLNNVYEGAFKFNTNTTHAPTTISGKILAFKIGNDNYRYQIVMHDYTINLYIRYRYYYGGKWVWSDWYALLSKNDLNSLYKKRYLMTPLSKGPTQYYFAVANFGWDLGRTDYNVTISSAQGGYSIDPSKFTITKYTYGFRIYTSEATYNGLVCECDVS